MLSKGKGTAPCSAHTRCPSSEAAAPGDAAGGDEAGPPLHVSIPSGSQVHLHCAGDRRSCCCTRGRIWLSWNSGNAAGECSIRYLCCKSRCCSCNSKSPSCRIRGKKAGIKSRVAERVRSQHTNSSQCYVEVRLSSSRPYTEADEGGVH